MTRKSVWAAVAILLALAGYERFVRPALVPNSMATGKAEWIWADADPGPNWQSVFLFRDFELNRVPQQASLVVQVDEAYWAYINGIAIGSGVYREGGSLDLFGLSDELQTGSNRVALEVRSRRGVGGALARLQLGSGDEERSIVTDGTWLAADRYTPGVLEPAGPTADSRTARVWGRPPIGRWNAPESVVRLPVLANQLVSSAPIGIDRLRPLDYPRWTRRFSPPEHRVPLGRWVYFDFGRTVRGYLNVVFAERGGAKGLVYVGDEGTFEPGNAEPATHLVVGVGRGSWTDTTPRSFRFVTVLATAEISGVRAYEVKPDIVESRSEASTPDSTAFEFEPPSRMSIEDEFWSEVERLTGLRGREAFEREVGG